MASKYGMVKCYFEHGLWSSNQVKDAVTKGLINSDEYKAITGEVFDNTYLMVRTGKNKKVKSVKQYIVNTFTDEVFSGKTASVCVLTNEISDEIMHKIALENRVETTAFVLKKGKTYEIRWFTYSGEIDICGYSILASAYVIMNYHDKNKEEIEFDTRIGKIVVEKNDDVFEMDYPQYPVEQAVVSSEIENAFGITPEEVYIGRDMLVVFGSEDDVINLKPDMEKLKKFKGNEVHITSRGGRYDCIARSFSPKNGVNEGSVYGIGHCYIAPYWRKVLGQNVIVSRDISKRGGTVYCKIVKEGRVKLCGKAMVYSEGEIYIG